MEQNEFRKDILEGIESIFNSYKLPGLISPHIEKAIRKIFLEQLAIYRDVLNWDLNKRKLLHFAAFIWKEFKNDLLSNYLENSTEYEKLIRTFSEFYLYCDNYFNDSLYKFSVLLNPFISKSPVSKQEKESIKAKKIAEARAGKSKYLPIISKVIEDMKNNSEINFTFAVERNIEKQMNTENMKKNIRDWMNGQLDRHSKGERAIYFKEATKLKDLIKSNYRKKRPKLKTS